MLIRRHSDAYNFAGDTETGITMRWGRSIEEHPRWAPWPELADISISNHCTAGCAYCYRDSKDDRSFMSLDEYEAVLDALTHPHWGSVFQVALGGGEPLEHPEFIQILEATKQRGIVANFTTNARHVSAKMAEQIAGLVGAVAVSVSSIKQLRREKVNLLLNAGVRVNLHFILDEKSIHEGIDILGGRYNDSLEGVHAIVFLTYKPRGRAAVSGCLKPGAALDQFLQAVKKNSCSAHVGFDACFVPLLLSSTEIEPDYIDSCECAFFSVYIDEQMNVKPCSFATGKRDSWNLRECSMEEIWVSKYHDYREGLTHQKCQTNCKHTSLCHGRCVYFEQLQFCYS
jgi:radical SAM protein with 4Fe4S-binding SPASM domain